MTNILQHTFLSLYGAWYQTLAEVLRTQWSFLDAQYQLGVRTLDVLRGSPSEAPAPSQAEGPSPAPSPEERAHERTDRGLAPPNDVYEVQNRNRIDWSQLPEWARPSDPELFEGAHEG
jgi:hypothetical protein